MYYDFKSFNKFISADKKDRCRYLPLKKVYRRNDIITGFGAQISIELRILSLFADKNVIQNNDFSHNQRVQ